MIIQGLYYINPKDIPKGMMCKCRSTNVRLADSLVRDWWNCRFTCEDCQRIGMAGEMHDLYIKHNPQVNQNRSGATLH